MTQGDDEFMQGDFMTQFRFFSGFQLILISALIFVLSLSSVCFADEMQRADCLLEEPLITIELPPLDLAKYPEAREQQLGHWMLPAHPAYPDLITDGQVTVYLSTRSERGPALRLVFTYGKKGEFGLPFSFRKAQMSWYVDAGREGAYIDWSDACTLVGESIFPGQTLETLIYFPVKPYEEQVIAPVLQIWGSQN